MSYEPEKKQPLTPQMVRNIWIIWISAVILAALSLFGAAALPKNATWEWLHWIIIALWTLGPCTWFLVESARRSQPDSRGELNGQEKFFYDSSAKFWAGVLALLVAIYGRGKWIDKPETQVKSATTQTVDTKATPPAKSKP